MSKTRKKRRFTISKKSYVGIAVFTLLLLVLMCASGSIIFDRAIQAIYNERGYVVANIILEQIDHEKIAEYASTWKEDDYYQWMANYLKDVQDESSAAYIYIGVPSEDKTIKYIYDSGSNMGFVDPISAPFEEIWKAYTEGIKPEGYLVRRSKYGYLTSSCLPIKDSSGEVVALLFVDTNMKLIRTTLLNYVANMIIIALILLGAFCVMNWYFIHKNLIKPLMLIRKNVRNFAASTTIEKELRDSIHTNDELEDLAQSIYRMEEDIVDYIDNIQKITAEKERIGAELNVATRIQAEMLPQDFPPFPDRAEFDIFATMTPAKEVGGDFYDFFFIDDSHIALVIGDVSGKGVPAALFMVVVKTLIKTRAMSGKCLSPGKILEDVNARLCEGNKSNLFVTVWLGIIDVSSGKGMAANAGHEHPVIKRNGGQFELSIYKHSPAVATFEGLKFGEHEFELHSGDSLFVYTDGVTEATNRNNELYGTERLLEALNVNPNGDAEELLLHVKKSIKLFTEEVDQFDDITMLGFVYH